MRSSKADRLEGLKLGSAYKFSCIEEIEEREGTGREQRTLYLVEHLWQDVPAGTDEDRLFFEQIREKARRNEQVIKLRQANPLDKFQLALRQLIEDLMVQRMADNDKIMTRYMEDREFGSAAYAVLSKAIYGSISAADAGTTTA